MATLDPDRRNKHPRMLTEQERERLEEFVENIHYSPRYARQENDTRPFVRPVGD